MAAALLAEARGALDRSRLKPGTFSVILVAALVLIVILLAVLA